MTETWRGWLEKRLFIFLTLHLAFLLRWLRAFRRWVYRNERVGVILANDSTPNRITQIKALPSQPAGSLRIVLISDTHGFHRSINDLPPGDILIHCGDLLYESSSEDFAASRAAIKDIDEWLGSFCGFQHKLVIGGNHDAFLQRLGPTACKELFRHAVYLENEVWSSPGGCIVYATPHSLANNAASPNKAWQVGRDSPEAHAVVAAIPADCDILITHGPAAGKGDDPSRGMLGCGMLARRIAEIRPKLHCCGHVHQAHSVVHEEGITYVNASVADVLYCLRNPPVLFDFTTGGAGGAEPERNPHEREIEAKDALVFRARAQPA